MFKKQTKDKGTVIAEGDAESGDSKLKEATRVAGRMLEAKLISADDLQKKIAELQVYESSQIRDIESSMFSVKKGFATESEGISQPVIINETSNQRNANEELVEKLSSMFTLGQRNKMATEDDDFELKRVHGRI